MAEFNVVLDDKAKDLINEFQELLKKTYEKYREFYAAKCELCQKKCDSPHREIEVNYRFMLSVFLTVIDEVSEKIHISRYAVDALLIGALLRRRIADFVMHEIENQYCYSDDVDYIV